MGSNPVQTWIFFRHLICRIRSMILTHYDSEQGKKFTVSYLYWLRNKQSGIVVEIWIMSSKFQLGDIFDEIKGILTQLILEITSSSSFSQIYVLQLHVVCSFRIRVPVEFYYSRYCINFFFLVSRSYRLWISKSGTNTNVIPSYHRNPQLLKGIFID